MFLVALIASSSQSSDKQTACAHPPVKLHNVFFGSEEEDMQIRRQDNLLRKMRNETSE